VKYLSSSILAAALCAGCVVTTIEGPGAPPRVAPPPGQTSRAESMATETRAPEGPASVGARHLLVAYRGALRASAEITRTKEEAKQRADEALARAKKGEDFTKLVAEYSDEPGAADRGGELGRFERSSMDKPFADAAFALEPGELSEVVETDFGFHVIQRTE